MIQYKPLIAGLGALAAVTMMTVPAHAEWRNHHHGGGNAAGWAALGAVVGLGAGLAAANTAFAAPQYPQYAAPQPVYVQQQFAPQPVVYAPQPVYVQQYAPPQVYAPVAPLPVQPIYVVNNGGHRRH